MARADLDANINPVFEELHLKQHIQRNNSSKTTQEFCVMHALNCSKNLYKL
jgi:hypothetical protein